MLEEIGAFLELKGVHATSYSRRYERSGGQTNGTRNELLSLALDGEKR
jgi:hypothetical protein